MRTTKKLNIKDKRIYIPVAIFIFLVLSFVLNKILSPSASEQQTVTNTFHVSYCSEGETAPACDPNQNIFSGQTTSNTLSVDLTLQTVSDRTLCLQAEGEVPLLTELEGPLWVKNETTTLLTKPSIKTDTSGRVSLELNQNEMWTSPVTLTFKPKGYFARSVTSQTFDPTQCIAFTGENKLIRGDFNDDGKLDFDDVTLIIKAYRGTHIQSTSAVFGDTQPNFGDVLDIIKKYRQRDTYHDA